MCVCVCVRVCVAQLYANLIFDPPHIFFDCWHLSRVDLPFSQHLWCPRSTSSFFPRRWTKNCCHLHPVRQRSLCRIDKGSSHLFIQLPAGCWRESEHELSKGQTLLDTQLAWQGRTRWRPFSVTAQMCRGVFIKLTLCLLAKMTCYATLICQINDSLWSVLKWC